MNNAYNAVLEIISLNQKSGLSHIEGEFWKKLLAEWPIAEFTQNKPSVTAEPSGCVSFTWAQAFYETQKVEFQMIPP